jgi:antitoxin ParD1/3/4
MEKTMNIQLSTDMNQFVHDLVVTGRFSSEQEAVSEALRLLKSREQLRAEIAEGVRQLEQGEWVDGDEMFDELHREISAIENERVEGK